MHPPKDNQSALIEVLSIQPLVLFRKEFLISKKKYGLCLSFFLFFNNV